MLLFSYSHLSRRKKYQEQYSPSDAAMTNKEENRNAIEMKTLANTAALQHDTEDPTSAPVAVTGASITTASSATTGATTTTATTTTSTLSTTIGATGETSAVVDPFKLSEDQIKSSRGMFS